MKTIIKNQETGNRKYKKVMVKLFALMLGLVLVTSTVSSQNSFEMGQLINATVQERNVRLEQPHQDTALLASALRSVIVHTSPTVVEISSFKFEPMKEKGLEIEGWMTDISHFGPVVSFGDEKGEPLEMEQWIMNEQNFVNSTITFTAEREPKMRVEKWMVSEGFWSR